MPEQTRERLFFNIKYKVVVAAAVVCKTKQSKQGDRNLTLYITIGQENAVQYLVAMKLYVSSKEVRLFYKA